MTMTPTFALSFCLFALAHAGLPSCDEDTAAHCLGDDADLSPEGIAACLAGLGDKASEPCKAFNTLVTACDEQLSKDGICGSDHANGDGMPCLLQRTPVDSLTGACQEAVQTQKAGEAPDTSLRGTFWADGKRQLNEEEKDALSEEDLTMYNRWWARKQKRAGKNSDVNYAIREQKKAKHTKIVTHKAAQAAQKVLVEAGSSKSGKKAAKKAAQKVIVKELKALKKEDKEMKFDKSEKTAMVKAAIKRAEQQIRQDKIDAQNKGL